MMLLKWLSVADRFAKAHLGAKLAPLGINSSQHMYLLKVCAQPGVSQDSLLDSFYVHPSNVVRTVSALEKKGFIRREPSEQDRRTWLLYPTQKALSAVPAVRAACDETEALLISFLDGRERESFPEALMSLGRRIAAEQGVEREGDEFDE